MQSSKHHHHHRIPRATSSSSDEDLSNARHALINESPSSLQISGGSISRDPSDYDLALTEPDGEQAAGSRPPSVSVSSSMVDVSSSAASTPLQANSHRPSPQLLAAMHDVLASLHRLHTRKITCRSHHRMRMVRSEIRLDRCHLPWRWSQP